MSSSSSRKRARESPPPTSTAARDESFDATVKTLFSSQHRGAALNVVAAAREQTVPQMAVYLRRVADHAADRTAAGHFMAHWSQMPCVHVTGTKGKGSTCAFVEGILRQLEVPRAEVVVARSPPKGSGGEQGGRGPVTLHTGTFTSPHLVRVTERFRVDGQPVRDAVFIESFWEVWDALQAAAAAAAAEGDDGDALEAVPGYFRLVTIVAFWIFAKERVDVAIIEVGCGGRHDATNILGATIGDGEARTWQVGQLVATGVTTLDLDHTQTLGSTLAAIANEKGGIYKRGVPALTVPQADEAMAVLHRCVTELHAPDAAGQPATASATVGGSARSGPQPQPLFLVNPITDLARYLTGHEQSARSVATPELPGSLAPDFQRTNAALAVTLASYVSHHIRGEASHLLCGDELAAGASFGGGVSAADGARVVAVDVDAILRLSLTQSASPPLPSSSSSSSSSPLPSVNNSSRSYLLRGLAETSWPGRCQTLHLARPPPALDDGLSRGSGVSVRWHVDCAHTPKSMGHCRQWFESVTVGAGNDGTEVGGAPSSTVGRFRVLIFNCSHEKDVVCLVETLARESGSAAARGVPTFHHAIFCPASAARPSRHKQPEVSELLAGRPGYDGPTESCENVYTITENADTGKYSFDASSSASSSDSANVSLSWQKTLAELWRHLHSESPNQVEETGACSGGKAAPAVAVATDLRTAMRWIYSTAPGATAIGETAAQEAERVDVDVLITGSIYLVGGALSILAPGGDGVAPGQGC